MSCGDTRRFFWEVSVYTKHFDLFIKRAMIHAKCTICGEKKSFLPRAMEHISLTQVLMWCQTHFNHEHMES